MELEFGKKVRVGNFYILKHSKSLTKKEQKLLRSASGIPADVQAHLDRMSLPYIKVATVTESWCIEFVMGMAFFNALNSVNVVMDGEGNRQLYGVEAKNIEAMIVSMFADTSVVGDFEYQKGKQELLSEFLERASKESVDNSDEKESAKALDDVAKMEETRGKIIKISEGAKGISE